MPSRRQFITTCVALGAATIPGTATARTDRPTADPEAALATFGAGDVTGRVAPRALPRVGEAAATVADGAPEVADVTAGRLPSAPDVPAARDADLGALGDADIHAASVDPGIGGVAALAVGVSFTARGPVVRARVTGADGAPARTDALDALAAAGLPIAALDPFAVRDGDDLALYAGVADRDGEQPFVLALLVVVLAAVIGTFVLGLGDSVERTAPQASFTFDYEAGSSLTITHDGGDSIPADQLRIVGDGVDRPWGRSGTVTAGDSVSVEVPSDATVRVIWSSPDGGDSATLAKWVGPDA